MGRMLKVWLEADYGSDLVDLLWLKDVVPGTLTGNCLQKHAKKSFQYGILMFPRYVKHLGNIAMCRISPTIFKG